MSFATPIRSPWLVAALAVVALPARAAGQDTEAPLLVPVPLVVIVPAADGPAVEASAPAGAWVPPAAPVIEITDADIEDVDIDDEDESFTPGFVSLGASVLVGLRETSAGVTPTWAPGIDLGFRLGPWVALGVRRFGVGAVADTGRWTIGVSPYVELTVPVLERIHLYGQVGAALEMRIASQRGVSLEPGVAPFGDVGVRFHPCDVFSIAFEGAAHLPVLGGLSLGDSIAPELAVILQAGLAMAFHFE